MAAFRFEFKILDGFIVFAGGSNMIMFLSVSQLAMTRGS
jgi:hypothetical protein